MYLREDHSCIYHEVIQEPNVIEHFIFEYELTDKSE